MAGLTAPAAVATLRPHNAAGGDVHVHEADWGDCLYLRQDGMTQDRVCEASSEFGVAVTECFDAIQGPQKRGRALHPRAAVLSGIRRSHSSNNGMVAR
ncbi:hypothetical protein [Actinoplanes philippinensis]|uniref:hypothetical protein n=1 Tax=Actinoplanes philippinensis TaxID=35752 RepID=UPI0033EDC001